MNVLMIAATPFFSDRGCHIRIYSEIKYLKKNDIDVTLCTYHNGRDVGDLDIKRIIKIPWYNKSTPGASWHKLYLDLLLFFKSYKVFLKKKPKIIHAHLYEGLFIGFLIKLLSFRKIVIIFDCQGSLAQEMYDYTLHRNRVYRLFYKPFELIERTLLKIPNKILCSSKNSYDFVKNRYKIKDNNIDILVDAVDHNIYKRFSGNDINRTKNKFNIPIHNTVITYTGSLSDAKGISDLLKVIPMLLSKMNGITFLFAGYGDLEECYTKQFSNFIKQQKIIFTGRFNYFNLSKILALSDFAIEPKKNSSESSGKLLNYAGANLPIICFKNEFNYNFLGDDGIYINHFYDIPEILEKYQKRKITYQNIPDWNSVILKLIHNYQQ